METVIETSLLTKCYHGKNAVEDLDLSVPKGSIYGFLGPNGAGKSTTMKMLLGLAKPTRGKVTILGKTMSSRNRLSILRDTGSLIESPAYYGHLSGRDNLLLIASLKQVPDKQVDDVLRIVRLTDQQQKKVSHYSLGMKQRLGLAAALLGYPSLLLLDEPTNGLDPAGIQEMRELICTLPQKYGMTILVSSHLLAEIDQMATHVGIIDKGILIFQDRLTVLHEHSRPGICLRTTDNDAACRLLVQNGMPILREEDMLYLDSHSDSDVLRVGHLLYSMNIGLLRIEERQASLEDIFLSLVGQK
ncbi:MAG: ATP-binding cassette domain-containing protein [Lachnospiraceae bacterium]|nr:ATP-binding cassette domain-containing protein [Lachnospiraceae bacterium]MCM1241174.1 ATP-binding cassette domain-containing protein [Lachnospiraceae bacterium]